MRGDEPAAVPDDARVDRQQTTRTSRWRSKSSRKGAAIESVTLNEFRKTAEDQNARYIFQEPYSVDGDVRDDTRSLATRSITIDGHEVDLSKCTWKLDSSDARIGQFSVEILNGDTPVAHVTKTYKLSPRSEDPNTPQGYEVTVSHRVENLTDKPITVEGDAATARPRRRASWSGRRIRTSSSLTADEGTSRSFSHLIESDFNKDTPGRSSPRATRAGRWSGRARRARISMRSSEPIPFDGKRRAPKWIDKVVRPRAEPDDGKAEDRRVVHADGDERPDSPGRSDAKQFDIEVYFGPKAARC